jgi:hypothetical protein
MESVKAVLASSNCKMNQDARSQEQQATFELNAVIVPLTQTQSATGIFLKKSVARQTTKSRIAAVAGEAMHSKQSA